MPDRDAARPPHERRPVTARRAAVVIVALLVLALTWALAADGQVAGWEASVFRALNQGPGWLQPPLWVVMQFGALGGATVVAVATWVITRDWRPALAVGAAAAVAWSLARVVKEIVERGRPAALLRDVQLPGTTASGYGFVSGHSAVAFAMATVLAPLLPRPWRWTPFVLATAVALARMQVGVHLPLDVLGGAAVGVAVGAVVDALLDPRPRTTDTDDTPAQGASA